MKVDNLRVTFHAFRHLNRCLYIQAQHTREQYSTTKENFHIQDQVQFVFNSMLHITILIAAPMCLLVMISGQNVRAANLFISETLSQDGMKLTVTIFHPENLHNRILRRVIVYHVKYYPTADLFIGLHEVVVCLSLRVGVDGINC